LEQFSFSTGSAALDGVGSAPVFLCTSKNANVLCKISAFFVSSHVESSCLLGCNGLVVAGVRCAIHLLVVDSAQSSNFVEENIVVGSEAAV
jgi:hypothetical protein